MCPPWGSKLPADVWFAFVRHSQWRLLSLAQCFSCFPHTWMSQCKTCQNPFLLWFFFENTPRFCFILFIDFIPLKSTETNTGNWQDYYISLSSPEKETSRTCTHAHTHTHTHTLFTSVSQITLIYPFSTIHIEWTNLTTPWLRKHRLYDILKRLAEPDEAAHACNSDT